MMSYPETIDYLYSRLPMFSTQGSAAIKKDLVNIRKLCDALGNPQHQFKAIHVAGTNGKGSTSHMLAAILQTAGYKTGLYTSPHLLDFRERIRISGEMISKDEVVDFIKNHQELIEEIRPSFFEVTVALAFLHFATHKVDFAIIETGLGGRLDSTNIISPILSVITNISLDHVDILGNTLEEIAREKAGIIKENTPVVISEKSKETSPIFEEKAKKMHSKLTFASSVWNTNIQEKGFDTLTVLALPLHNKTETEAINTHPEAINSNPETFLLDLTGNYQRKNLAGVLAAVDEITQLGYPISREAVHIALQNVKKLTGLMGRWHKLGDEPLIVCDTGHNEKGWEEILININQLKYDHLHIVLGVMRDKDIMSLLRTLPQEATYYFCRANFDRALPSEQLKQAANEKGLKGESYESITEAIIAAKSLASTKDALFIGGSTFVVAEALEYFSTP